MRSLDKCGELGILVDAGTRLPDMQALLRANYETNARRLQAEADAAVEAIASRSKAGDIGGALLAATEAAEQYPWHGQLRALRDELEAKPLPPPSYVPASGAAEAPTISSRRPTCVRTSAWRCTATCKGRSLWAACSSAKSVQRN